MYQADQVRPGGKAERFRQSGKNKADRVDWVALSSNVRPHSMGCQIRHILKIVHVLSAARQEALLTIFVDIFCAYIDVSYFLWGDSLYIGKVVE